MKRKSLALALAAVLCVSSLTACGSSGNDSKKDTADKGTEAGTESGSETKQVEKEKIEVPDEPTKGGTLTVSLSSSPRNLDPAKYTGSYEGQVINNVCDRVVEYNKDLSEIVPSLAESWTVSDDGLTYVFKIRQGVKFQKGEYQDGREMTAEDIAYSLNRSAKDSSLNRLDMLENAEVTGDWEVTCTLAEPNAAFLTALTDAGNSVVPKEEVEGWGDDFGAHLVGTGPFAMESFELDQQSVLVKNPDYWVAEPNLDKLVFKVITDSNQAANALKTGEIDIASSITGEAVQSVRDDSKLQLMEMPGLHVAYIYFNQVNGPTADKKVREALIKAINVEEMTASIYQYGEAVPAKLSLPPGSWGYDASCEELVPDYDPEGAKKLLAEAGYPDGFECDLYISNTALREKMATLVQAYLKTNLNVTVNINKSEWGTFSESASSGNADMYGMSWTWYPDPYFFLNKLFSSKEIGALGNGQGFSNPEVDQLLDDALKATDQNERADMYKKALRIVTEELPGIFYSNENVIHGLNPEVQDFVQKADNQMFFVTPWTNVWKVQ